MYVDKDTQMTWWCNSLTLFLVQSINKELNPSFLFRYIRIMSTKKRKNSDERVGSPMFGKNSKIPKLEVDDTQNSGTDPEDDKYPPFLLISSIGPSATIKWYTFGLYRKTETMKEGRNVYKQEHYSNDPNDSTFSNCNDFKLFSEDGVWCLVSGSGFEDLRATTASETPTSVQWEYKYNYKNNGLWRVDPALTVIGLSEKPRCECEVTISLSENVKEGIEEPGVEGVYTAQGSYCNGKPVLQHSGGLFTLSVKNGKWMVESRTSHELILFNELYLSSGSAPGLCPADPRVGIKDDMKMTFWSYEPAPWWVIVNEMDLITSGSIATAQTAKE